MQLLNSSNRYGLVSVIMHWLVALAVFALFALGLWMTGLSYYSEWYRTAPALHKSVGAVLFAVMLVRLLWRFLTPKPAPLSTHSASERLLSRLGHAVLYLGIFVVMISGYLISTADGRGISVFELFEIPALITGLPNQADLAGEVHFYVAWGLVVLAVLHGLAALKHHFIDRDATLKRMLGCGPK